MYGIDVDLDQPRRDPLLREKSWRWLLVRLTGLMTIPDATQRSRLAAAVHRHVTPQEGAP